MESSVTRPSDFDPQAVPVRPAVSVLMVRQTPRLEVFVQHRVTTMDFAAGMVVYPGGRVDDSDHHTPIQAPQFHAHKWQRTAFGADAHNANALLAAAVREVAEETGAQLDPTGVYPWANWVTPMGHPRRFDTYFYVADSSAIDAAHQTTEATNSEWTTVNHLIEEYSAKRIDMMRPTLTLLYEISELGSVEAIVTRAKHRSIQPVRPHSGNGSI